MKQDVTLELAALRRMTPAQLRDKYLEVFGEPTRSGNRDFLFKRLAWRIQSLAEGSLSERARQRAEELARDADIRMTMPKASPVTTGGHTSVKPAPALPSAHLPLPGTVLTRQYKGRMIQVTVLQKGFEYDGQVYKSLTAIANQITGSHWNGLLFFGLKQDASK